MDFVEEVKRFVEEECGKPISKYGAEPFEGHFVPMVEYAKLLGEKKNADIEIIEVAGWLHDIGSILVARENHHVTSCEIAEKKLRDLGYSEDKIEKVKHCIFSHRGSQDIKRESVEAEIIAEADAMSHFDCIEGLFKAAYLYENCKSQKEAKKKVLQKLINSYNKLSDEGKELVKDKFEAAMLLFDGESKSK